MNYTPAYGVRIVDIFLSHIFSGLSVFVSYRPVAGIESACCSEYIISLMQISESRLSHLLFGQRGRYQISLPKHGVQHLSQWRPMCLISGAQYHSTSDVDCTVVLLG